MLVGLPSHEAVRALGAARTALFAVRHPHEPTDPPPSFVSDVEPRTDGAELWFDIADAEASPGLVEHVLEAVVAALTQAGVSQGRLFSPGDELDGALDEVAPEAIVVNPGIRFDEAVSPPPGTTMIDDYPSDEFVEYRFEHRSLGIDEVRAHYERALTDQGWRIDSSFRLQFAPGEYSHLVEASRDHASVLVTVQPKSSWSRWNVAIGRDRARQEWRQQIRQLFESRAKDIDRVRGEGYP